MAILKNGLWGGITGKLGNTVCYMLNGKQVVRMIVKSNKPPTQRQLDNWAEMARVNCFLKPVKNLVQIGYGAEAKKTGTYAYNLAMSHTRKYALKGERPNREIDYSRVLLSKGHLPGADIDSVVLEDGVLRVTWLDDMDVWGRDGSSQDQVMLVVYLPEVSGKVSRAYYSQCGTERCKEAAELTLPGSLSDRPMEIYLFVVAADEKSVSESQYLGSK